MPVITLNEIKIKDNLTFSLYGAVNGAVEMTGVVISKMSALAVPTYSSAPTDHVNIYRDLPAEIKATIENDWQSYNYIALKRSSDVVYIGEPWIVLGTLFRNDVGKALVTLNSFRDADSLALRILLESNGYTVDKISIV